MSQKNKVGGSKDNLYQPLVSICVYIYIHIITNFLQKINEYCPLIYV